MKMKYPAILLLLTFGIIATVTANAQQVKITGRNYNKYVTTRPPSLSVFRQELYRDTGNRVRFKTLPVEKVFRKSATIFDATVIALLKDSTYIAYFYGCLADGITAGNFTLKGDTLLLSGSEKVYRSLQKNPEVKALKFGRMEWGTLQYLVRKDYIVPLN